MKLTTREMILVAMFPALMGATALVSIPLGSLPPITLQTLFVFLAGLLLRKELSFISMIIYIFIGIIGVPVFALGTAGLGVILGPTGGFILAFPIAAGLTSIMKSTKFINNEYINTFVVLFGINLIIYMIGGAYFIYITNMNIGTTVALFGTYIPGDILKIIAAIYVYVNIRSHITYEYS